MAKLLMNHKFSTKHRKPKLTKLFLNAPDYLKMETERKKKKKTEILKHNKYQQQQ